MYLIFAEDKPNITISTAQEGMHPLTASENDVYDNANSLQVIYNVMKIFFFKYFKNFMFLPSMSNSVVFQLKGQLKQQRYFQNKIIHI